MFFKNEVFGKFILCYKREAYIIPYMYASPGFGDFKAC